MQTRELGGGKRIAGGSPKFGTWLVAAPMAICLGLMASAGGAPQITRQPESLTVVAGETAVFSVEATGAGPLRHQWRAHVTLSAFTNITWGTNETLALANAQPTSLRFGVVVSDQSGAVTSVLARLTVLVPPRIESEPQSRTVAAGEEVLFAVSASGTEPLAYQWHFEGNLLAGGTGATLTLAAADLAHSGRYQVSVSNVAGVVTSAPALLRVVSVSNSFVRVTGGAAPVDGVNSIGCAWGDYDNDGYLDLVVANLAGANLLYRNLGNGGFMRIAAGPIGTDTGAFRGCCWGDFDGDEFLDLFVANSSGDNVLYRNRGDATFEKVTVGALVSDGGYNNGATWCDYDNDGWLDLLVATGLNGQDYLYRGLPEGGFAHVTTGPVPVGLGNTLGLAWGDYDNDGLPDLAMANGGIVGAEEIFLFHNAGGGAFARVSTGPIAAVRLEGVGASWGDYDNDDRLDLFVTQNGTNRLFNNLGGGSFAVVNAGSPVTDGGGSAGCAWGDYNNDGWLDLFVANGGLTGPEVNFLYMNAGDGTLVRVRHGPFLTDADASVGCGWADYDNDGYLDLFVANGFSAGAADYLYRNLGGTNHWLKVRCLGGRSNPSALGSVVRVQAEFGGRLLWQRRDVVSGDGLCGNPLELHFGLGAAERVTALRVRWPGGICQEWRNVPADQRLVLREPPGLEALGMDPAEGFGLRLHAAPGRAHGIEVSTNLQVWSPWRTVTNVSRSVDLLDPAATGTHPRFYRASSAPAALPSNRQP